MAEAMNEKIEGKYVWDGTEYTYEAAWVNAQHGLAWMARVFAQGALYSTPGGSMAQVTTQFDPENLVKTVVHKAIERGISKI